MVKVELKTEVVACWRDIFGSLDDGSGMWPVNINIELDNNIKLGVSWLPDGEAWEVSVLRPGGKRENHKFGAELDNLIDLIHSLEELEH